MNSNGKLVCQLLILLISILVATDLRGSSISTSLVTVQSPAPKAYFREDYKNHEYHIAVITDPPIKKGSNLNEVKASLFQNGQLVAGTTIGPPDSWGSDFTVQISNQAILSGNFKPITLVVSEYPTDAGSTGFITVVGFELKPTLTTKNPSCERHLSVFLSGENDEGEDSPYAIDRANRLRPVFGANPPGVRIESHTKADPEPRTAKVTATLSNPTSPTVTGACLALSPDPPSGTYDLELQYSGGAPLEIRRPLLKTNLVALAHKSPDPTSAPTNDGKRSLEDNLDLSLQLASSVKDVEQNGSTQRLRDTKWKMGMKLAPFSNILEEVDVVHKTFHYWTPLFIDARVANGKITEDTLSLNRIYIGSEAEVRHYSKPNTYPTYQRYLFRFLNASDRDFKQAEWTAGFEFQPVLSKLNRPLRWDLKAKSAVLDNDPDRGPKIIPNLTGFGFQVLPQVGFQIGRTYRNQRSFAAIEQTDVVRRFYFGGTLNVDLTAYLRLAVTDVLYIRGETPNNRGHNYFLGSAEIPLPSFSKDSGHAFVFSFERGGQPPFSSPDVNALTFGYRVQWAGWFKRYR